MDLMLNYWQYLLTAILVVIGEYNTSKATASIVDAAVVTRSHKWLNVTDNTLPFMTKGKVYISNRLFYWYGGKWLVAHEYSHATRPWLSRGAFIAFNILATSSIVFLSWRLYIAGIVVKVFVGWLDEILADIYATKRTGAAETEAALTWIENIEAEANKSLLKGGILGYLKWIALQVTMPHPPIRLRRYYCGLVVS